MENKPEAPTQEETAGDRLLSRIPIHLQILGGFLVLQTCVMASSFFFIQKISTQQLKTDIHTQLKVAVSVFQSLLTMRNHQLTLEMDLLSKDFAFKKALATHDSATINSASVNLRDRIGATVLWVVDDNGAAIAE